MAPKASKKEAEVPVFDLKKPDVSPIDKKLQGEDEQSMCEAFNMMLYVPHTDGYKASTRVYTQYAPCTILRCLL